MTEPNDHAIDKPFHSAGEVIDVLASIRLADVVRSASGVPREDRGWSGHELRMRRIVLAPGGVIANHSHVNRPAILHLVEGALLEFSGERDEAVEHTAPAVVASQAEHWWRNPGDLDAVIVGADLFDPSIETQPGGS